MLNEIANGVWVHESSWLKSNAIVVQGNDGVLLIDAGITADEMITIASDLSALNKSVIAAFSTHPHWDHLLWHSELGDAPRYGTAQCATAIQAFLSNPNWRNDIAAKLPPDIDVPLDGLGLINGLPASATHIPWDGPRVRIIEHQAHAPGHASLLIEESKVLVAGDTLSDYLIPMLDGRAGDPVGDYLNALDLLEGMTADTEIIVPGHGSVGDASAVHARIEQDRAYLNALRDGKDVDDPRIDSRAAPGWEWVSGVHTGQLQRLTS